MIQLKEVAKQNYGKERKAAKTLTKGCTAPSKARRLKGGPPGTQAQQGGVA